MITLPSPWAELERQLHLTLTPPFHILAVDDEVEQRGLLSKIFAGSDYVLATARDANEALELMAKREFDIVLLDHNMPGMTGIELCRKIRADMGQPLLPIIMVTGMNSTENLVQGMAAGVTDFIGKPYSVIELMARVNSNIARKRLVDHLDNVESILFSLARIVEARDAYTGDHCNRLAHLSMQFGMRLKLSVRELEGLRRGGILHDIGKLVIPDSILLKDGPLDKTEWEIMQRHPVIGAELCRPLSSMRDTLDVIRGHHERWNGTGYPAGLAKEKIPFLARLFQIVDIFDALTNKRPYKAAFTVEKAAAIIEEETERGFCDPDLAPQFLSMIRNSPSLHAEHVNPIDLGGRIFDKIQSAGILNGCRFSL